MWKTALDVLPKLHRQLYWIYGGYVVLAIVANGLLCIFNADALADGSDLFAEVGVVPCSFDEAVRRALANRPGIVHSAHTGFWDGRRYHLTQRFQLSATTRCDSPLLDRIDEELRQLTPRLAPGVLRWHGDELRLAGWSLRSTTRRHGSARSTVDGSSPFRAACSGSRASTAPRGR